MMMNSSILHLGATGQIGGAELSLLRLITGLKAVGWASSVILAGGGPLVHALSAEGVPVQVMKFHRLRARNPLPFGRMIRDMLRFAAQNRVSIVHTNHHWVTNDAVLLSRLIRAKSVCHMRGVEPVPFWQARKRALQLADVIVTVSKAVAVSLAEAGIDGRRIEVVYDGVELERFDSPDVYPVLRSELGLPADTPLIGFVGRLCPEKGVEDFLAAAARILPRTPNARFVIVGEPDSSCQNGYLSKLKRLAGELALEHACFFCGLRRDIPQIMRSIDIFALPTWQEACPNTVLEAMASRVPVLASRVGGVPELVEHGKTGVLHEPRDTEAIAQGMLCLLNMPDAARLGMGLAGQARVRAHFSIQKHVERMHGLFGSLLQN